MHDGKIVVLSFYPFSTSSPLLSLLSLLLGLADAALIAISSSILPCVDCLCVAGAADEDAQEEGETWLLKTPINLGPTLFNSRGLNELNS